MQKKLFIQFLHYFLGIFLCAVALTGCFAKRKPYTLPNNQKPITIFIHGTMPPIIETLVHIVDVPLGLTPACRLDKRFIHQRMSFILNKFSPEQFPLDSFYFFGWSGDLSFTSRQKAAQDLYEAIKDFSGPITLISHSHGGNVALELVPCAKNASNNLVIDRLVLLACPIQVATASYAQSPLFRKVFSLYSQQDMLQVLDPQGLYKETKKSCTRDSKTTLFSERLLPGYPNVVQARILMCRQNPWHISFILPRFLKQLSKVLDVLNTLPTGTTCVVDITRCGQIEIIKK